MKLIRGMAAIVVGGGLLVSGQSFALCSLPPGSVPGAPAGTPGSEDPGNPGTDTTDPTTGSPTVTPEPPHVRIPVPVPTYSPNSSAYGPGGNATGNGNGTASYNNRQVVVAPTDRAAAERSEWCRRTGRSLGSMEACLKSVSGK